MTEPLVPCEGTIFRICRPGTDGTINEEPRSKANWREFFEKWMATSAGSQPVANELDFDSLQSGCYQVNPSKEDLELAAKIGEHPVIAGIATGMTWTKNTGEEKILYFWQKGITKRDNASTILSELDSDRLWIYWYMLGIVSALAHLEAKHVKCVPVFSLMKEEGTGETFPIVVCEPGWRNGYAEQLKAEFRNLLDGQEAASLKEVIDHCDDGKLDELFCKMVQLFDDKEQWQRVKNELTGGRSSTPDEKIEAYIRTLQMASTQDLTRHQESVIKSWFVDNGSLSGDWPFTRMKEFDGMIAAIQSNMVGSELQITDWKTRTPGFLARFLGQDALILTNHPWSLFRGQADAAAVVLENNDCIEMQFKKDVTITRIKVSGCEDYPISIRHVRKNGEEVEVKHTLKKLPEKEAMITIGEAVAIGSMELLRIYNASPKEEQQEIQLTSITVFDCKNEDSGEMLEGVTVFDCKNEDSGEMLEGVTVYKDGKPCGDFTSTSNTALVSGDSNPLLITAIFTEHLITLRSCAIIPSQGQYSNTDFVLEVGDESSNWKSVEGVEYVLDNDDSRGSSGKASRLCMILNTPVTANRFRLKATAPLTYFDIFGVCTEKNKQ